MGIERMWPLGFAALIPGIILLYLLKQKVQKKTVPALNLWREAYENMQAVTPWEKFRHHLLLYLQILALLLLIGALLAPLIRWRGGNGERVVLCLDQSGSMNGRYGEGVTKLEEAREQAKQLVKQLKSGTKVTLLTSGTTASILASDVTDTLRLCQLIDGIIPTDASGDLQAGIQMAESIAKQWGDYQFVGFTDADADLGELTGEIVDVSSTYENCGVDWVTHREQEDGTVQVQAKIENYGEKTAAGEVSLYLGQDLYDVQSFSVEAKENRIVTFHALAASRFQRVTEEESYLRAEINQEDGLTADNEGYELLQGGQEKRILLVTKQNSFLERALQLSENIVLEKAVSVDNINASREYDMIVYDGIRPKRWYGNENILLINPKRDLTIEGKWVVSLQGAEKNQTIQVPVSDLTDGLENFSFGCSKTDLFALPDWAYSIMRCGRESAGYTGDLQGRRITVLGFDLHQTDLPLQMEFPILMYHIASQGRQGGSLRSAVLSPGEAAELLCGEETDRVTWALPDGTRRQGEVRDGKALMADTERAGIYEVREQEKGKEKTGKKKTGLQRFVVGFPAAESAVGKGIRVQTGNGEVQQAKRSAQELHGEVSLQKPILCILLCLLCAEWIIYRKRI